MADRTHGPAVAPLPPSTQQSSWGRQMSLSGSPVRAQARQGADLTPHRPSASGACLEVIRASHAGAFVIRQGFQTIWPNPLNSYSQGSESSNLVHSTSWSQGQIPERGVSPWRLLRSLWRPVLRRGRGLPLAREVVLRPLEGRTLSPRVPGLPSPWGSSTLAGRSLLPQEASGLARVWPHFYLQTPSQAEPLAGGACGLRPSCCPVPLRLSCHSRATSTISWCARVHVCLCVCVCELGCWIATLVEGGQGEGGPWT